MAVTPIPVQEVLKDVSQSSDPVLQRINSSFKIEAIGDVVGGGAVWFLIAAGLTMLICITLSALQWLNSGSDSTGMQAARTRLTNCLIGLSIVTLSMAILLIIQLFFGINLLRPE